jgi:hypothetical protein
MRENKDIAFRLNSIFIRLLYKSNFKLTNKSSSILGLDILRDCAKRDLFIIVCNCLEKKILSLFDSKSNFYQPQIFKSSFLTLVSQTSEIFLKKYYGRPINVNQQTINKCLYNRIATEDIQILFQIPVYSLVESECKLFRATFAPIYNTATDSFLESLFENLIIEIINCVLFIIINEFSDIYDVRQNLYKANFLSVRSLERFKNNFTWQTIIRATIERPKNIYNSRYGLWVIRSTGVYYKVIYANQSNALSKLRKTPLATVTFIEFIDFTYSRFDEVFYTFGNSLRYGLTSFIGQVIGLIWRGIIEGLKY